MSKLIKKCLVVLSMLPVTVSAALNEPTRPNGVPNSSLDQMVNMISNAILTIVGVIAVLMLIIGGFMYVSSAGNPDSVSKAKGTIMYAIIGLVVAILAWGVVKYVIGAF